MLNVMAPEFCAAPEKTPTGFFYAAADGLTAELNGMPGGIICRVPSKTGDYKTFVDTSRDDETLKVVQLGIGNASGLLCNSVYSPAKDLLVTFAAEGLEIKIASESGENFEIFCTGPLTVTTIEKYIALHCGFSWYTPMDKKIFKRPPSGWCSWYYYYLKITEDEVIKNTDWLAKNLKQFGCEWVQIDDGWQGHGDGLGDNRDWFVTCPSDFPNGMKYTADYIKSKGMKPGIWCIPFTQSDSELFDSEPELFLHRPDGTSPGTDIANHRDDVWFEWPGMYHLDLTSETAKKYLDGLFKMFCVDWGYEYIKADGTTAAAAVHDKYRADAHDPSINGSRAYRIGIDAIKKIMGSEKFLLNCICGTNWAALGLSEGMRTGGDVDLTWRGISNGTGCTIDTLFLNTIATYTDPDVVCVRDPLPIEQARLWVTFLGITGQLLMASDKMYELSDDRVELLRRIFPVADIHPMELYPLDKNNMAPVFNLKVCLPHIACWDVAAVFNWTDVKQVYTLTPKGLGLSGSKWICTDVWNGCLQENENGVIKAELEPHTCKVFAYWKKDSRPQFVGTNRHLTQGADDLLDLKWDGDGLVLSGRSAVVKNDVYKVKIYVPEEYEVISPNTEAEGGLTIIKILRDANEEADWIVRFKKI
ncbi:MAG: alpha-galactosidase [Defluviitaleaceae bacterium]|nr:alpha-galactosidase [Defluviitaleaceae bacterium]